MLDDMIWQAMYGICKPHIIYRLEQIIDGLVFKGSICIIGVSGRKNDVRHMADAAQYVERIAIVETYVQKNEVGKKLVDF